MIGGGIPAFAGNVDTPEAKHMTDIQQLDGFLVHSPVLTMKDCLDARISRTLHKKQGRQFDMRLLVEAQWAILSADTAISRRLREWRSSFS